MTKLIHCRRLLLVAALFVTVVTCVLGMIAEGAPAQRPKCDFYHGRNDLGAADLGCFGASDMATPKSRCAGQPGRALDSILFRRTVCSASRQRC